MLRKRFTKGYLKGAKSFLTPIEIENLPYAAAYSHTCSVY